MATDQTEATNCAVCGEPVTFTMSAECNWCDRRYHLNQRNDVEAKDCGQVWIDEQFLALQFACDNCLRGGARGETAAAARAGDGPQPSRRRRYRRRE